MVASLTRDSVVSFPFNYIKASPFLQSFKESLAALGTSAASDNFTKD